MALYLKVFLHNFRGRSRKIVHKRPYNNNQWGFLNIVRGKYGSLEQATIASSQLPLGQEGLSEVPVGQLGKRGANTGRGIVAAR